MPACYPFENQDELEGMHRFICYLRSIGFAYVTLDDLLNVPSGVVRTWVYRGPDGFFPLLINGWYKFEFWLVILLFSFLGIWEDMEKDAAEEVRKDTDRERCNKFWMVFSKDIISLGGVYSYENEELVVVPKELIRYTGLEPGRIVQILADYFPCYGVKTEQDFFDICDRYEDFILSSWLK